MDFLPPPKLEISNNNRRMDVQSEFLKSKVMWSYYVKITYRILVQQYGEWSHLSWWDGEWFPPCFCSPPPPLVACKTQWPRRGITSVACGQESDCSLVRWAGNSEFLKLSKAKPWETRDVAEGSLKLLSFQDQTLSDTRYYRKGPSNSSASKTKERPGETRDVASSGFGFLKFLNSKTKSWGIQGMGDLEVFEHQDQIWRDLGVLDPAIRQLRLPELWGYLIMNMLSMWREHMYLIQNPNLLVSSQDFGS